MSSCFNCDSPVAPEDRFCGNCGLALQPPAPRAGDEGRAASASGQFAPDPQGYAEDLQPTLIEPSHGGQAAAAARASEPVEPAGAPESAPGPDAVSRAM